MTVIIYKCKGGDNEVLDTKSLPDAKRFIKEHGGSYNTVFKNVISDSEAYCIDRCRKPGNRT